MKKYDKIELLDEIERIEDTISELLDDMSTSNCEEYRKDLETILFKNENKAAELYKILNEET